MQNYETGKIAVDAVIFTIKNRELLVYLSTRDKDPYKNLSELPGGLLLSNETADETLSRKLKSIITNADVFFDQFYTFTDPKRDPRQRTISIGFIALVSQEKISNDQNFYEINNLPKMAFDHKKIIDKAYKYLQKNLDYRFAKQFLPLTFPLNDFQMIYEVINQKKIDNRNFRKKILNSGVIKKAKTKQSSVSHRPANLYQYSL